MPLADSTAPINAVEAASYTVPTDRLEADGTLAWSSTTLVLVRIQAGGCEGLGYGYGDRVTAQLIRHSLAPLLRHRNAFDIAARIRDMEIALRNQGRAGICAMAISIVDTALWDLKARCMGLPLAALLGRAHPAIDAYGSGGFTSYSQAELEQQLGDWSDAGFTKVKMKVGSHPAADPARVAGVARRIAPGTELFVDANGAYSRKQALALADHFAAEGVRWFEEPVSSDDLEGLHLLRNRAPVGMAIAAGEYGYTLPYFRRMLEAQAVDVLQADATRCGGVSGFLAAAALCAAFQVPLSSHCAPALHTSLCCAVPGAVHLEYFHDHARIEAMLFDDAPVPSQGRLSPRDDRPGLGLVLKTEDARCFMDS